MENSSRKILFEVLKKHFSLEEIKTICFHLGLDYDSVSGEEKNSKIRELILFSEKRGILSKLIAEIIKDRPTLSQLFSNGFEETKIFDEGLIIDVGSINEPNELIQHSEIRFSLTNTSPYIVKVISISLILSGFDSYKVAGFSKVASPIDEYYLYARLNPSLKSIELLDKHHEIRSKSEGFFLKIDATEGYTYSLKIDVLWKYLQSEPVLSSTNNFELSFPIVSAKGLLELTDELDN